MLTMPIVRPVPIPTLGLPWYRQLPKMFSPRKWEIIEDFEYHSKALGYSILIPAPFVCDGASVPRPLWPLLDPTGLLFIGAIVHDFGYRYRGLIVRRDGSPWRFESKARLDLDRIMESIVCEVNGMRGMARVARYAVNVGGWLAWWKNGRAGNRLMSDYPFLMQGATL